jgi:hypothetical protein
VLELLVLVLVLVLLLVKALVRVPALVPHAEVSSGVAASRTRYTKRCREAPSTVEQQFVKSACAQM